VTTDAGQGYRYPLWEIVRLSLKQSLNSSKVNGGEEVLKIEVEHEFAVQVPTRVCDYAPSAHEAMHRGSFSVDRMKNLVQFFLNQFQTRNWFRNNASSSGSLVEQEGLVATRSADMKRQCSGIHIQQNRHAPKRTQTFEFREERRIIVG